MVSWFHECVDVNEVKAEYRKLLFQLHPDRHPQEEFSHWNRMTQELNESYHHSLKNLNSTRYTGFDEKEHVYYYNARTEQEVMDKLNETLKAEFPEGVTVWLVGTWIWIEGTRFEDKPTREKLGALKFYWNRDRQMWAWHRKEDSAFGRFPGDFHNLVRSYGGRKVDRTKQKKEEEAYPAMAG